MNDVFLSIGSNISAEENITRIIESLKNNSKLSNIIVSDYYESEPVGFVSSNNFINIVVFCTTTLDAIPMLLEMQKIENQLNRKRDDSGNYIDRTADIDIIFFNDDTIDTEQLTIPHPHWQHRDFVVNPIKNILIKNSTLKRKNRWLKEL